MWGQRYGNGLGEAVKVDVPASEKDKKAVLRVRVKLPYDRRLQTQITTGVKGKPKEVKVFKLKYECVSYYCSHCGFMGHKKDECEKKRMGVPSLDYDTHELRYSPYKKFEHRSHYVPPAGQTSARCGLSFASFGSAESYKHFDQGHPREQQHKSVTEEHVQSRTDSVEEEMPPLIDDADLYPAVAATGHETVNHGPGGVETPDLREVESTLANDVEAMIVDQNQTSQQTEAMQWKDALMPIVQFSDEEGQDANVDQDHHIHVGMKADMLTQMQFMQGRHGAGSSGSSWMHGPRPNDMIPALQGLSNMQVSFGSMSDVSMPTADTVLGKRAAEEQEVQGQRLELSLGLNYEGK
ncbi:hypothetical protein ACQ4PT_029942 [Festuca glaucescens]